MTTLPATQSRSPANRTVRNTALALAGTVLLAISARISVPMWPVPISLQTLAVLMIGLTYGGRLATATLVLYLAEGAFGLPVFANGGGVMQFAGPTAGYLLGFLIAASLLGYASDRGMTRSVHGLIAMLFLATMAIYVPGALWLAGFVGIEGALLAGVMPFLIGDALKAAIAAMAVWALRKRPL